MASKTKRSNKSSNKRSNSRGCLFSMIAMLSILSTCLIMVITFVMN